MIKIKGLIATREPIPDFLRGLAPESLADLSWTDPALGVHDCAWWPEEAADEAISTDTHRYGAEILTLDTERRVVLVSHQVVALTSDELAERAAQLYREKATRKARIKSEAASLIEATDWKLARAREREAAGWATLAEVDTVLAEREAIRRSSNAAELAVDALTDAASVQAFAWSVDVQVATPRRLTHKQFMDRFSDGELTVIITAVEASAALRTWWTKFQQARDMNLDDPATIAGVQALEIAGLLGTGRAAEVLA